MNDLPQPMAGPLRPVLICCLMVLSMCAGAVGAGPVKIMPLGDSITDGGVIPGGYRTKLYSNLINAGYYFVYVGTAENNATPALTAAGQTHHEGHGGYLIHEVTGSLVDANWLGAEPDIILLLIGTNDYANNNDTPDATNRLDTLISTITSNRPNARVIVASLTLRTDNPALWDRIQSEFNPFVPIIVSNHVANGEKVFFADLANALTSDDLADGLHPNQTGYNKIAEAWFEVIRAALSPDTNAPTIVRAVDGAGLTNVNVTFSKTLADSSAQATNFTLNGGLVVQSAVLNTNNYLDILLHTSPQTANTTYIVTVNNVADRTTNHTLIASNSTTTFISGAAASGVFANVPEAAHYTLVYSLNIPNSANFNASGVPYAVDNRANVLRPFTRIAYYLELQSLGEPLQYIYASMDAFTSDVDKIGVATAGSGEFYQRNVSNLNVYSSVASIVQGTGLSGGSIEFWPSSFAPTNQAGVPNASNTTFDWGDGEASTNAGHGSMQIANHDASQVLLAYNGWGSGTNSDLGMGNQPGGNGNLDWTFADNAGTYTLKNLQVLVLETLRPIVHLDFNENTGTNTANRGSAGGTFGLTTPLPEWTPNVPTNAGGASALDFGADSGNFGVDSPAPISQLGGLTQFTICGWVNNRSAVQGSGGNRIISWLGGNNSGAELLYKSDGSLILTIDQVASGTAPRSSSGKITEDALADSSNWRFFAVTYDQTNSEVQFYFGSQSSDASLDVVEDYFEPGPVEPPTARLTVGNLNPERRSPSETRMFRGLIDDINIFHRVLSPTEIVLVQRDTIIPVAILTVTSTNPPSGVPITVSPNDNNDLGDGTTVFARTYSNNVIVTLTAPSSVGGSNIFQTWRRDGLNYSSNLSVAVTMDSSHTMEAVYEIVGLRVLTVASASPSNGVPIMVSPADTNGLSDGTTVFTRSYTNNTVVTLTAPSLAGTNEFQRWQLDGADDTTNFITMVTMDIDHTLTAIYAPPPILRTLTVASTNPVSGVSITVTPNDNSGLGSGNTPFTRTYTNNVVATLTAPETAGPNTFHHWQRDGLDYSSNLTITVTMDADYVMTAVYAPAPVVTLTVASEKPTNGVAITVSPPDTNGLANGTTPFTRNYSTGQVVTLTAPLTAGTNKFQKWQRNGLDYGSNLTTSVTMDDNHRLTAVYAGTITPILYLAFNENSGLTTTNRGTAGGTYDLTTPRPEWITYAPSHVGGISSLDFGTNDGLFAVDSPSPVNELGGLSGFTICGWLNNRSDVQMGAGNIIVTWLNEIKEGAELVYKADGSLLLVVNEGPGGSSPRSSIGKVTVDPGASSSNWVFFAATYDAVNGRSGFYFGGQTNYATLDATRVYVGQGATPAPTARLSVGNLNPERRTVQDRIFRGLIDQLHIYAGILSLNEIITVQRETLVAPPLTSQTNCPGSSVTFQTCASGGGPFTYQWTKDGTAISEATNNSYNISSVGAVDAGAYCVMVSGFYNSVTNCATLTVNEAVAATGPHSLTNCPGSSATLTTSASGTGPLTYRWTKDGTPISDATNSAYTIPTIGTADAGDYCVEVTAACNSVTNCATLTVNENVTVTGPNSSTNCPGTSLTFTTVTSGTGPLTYRWTQNGAEIAGATNSSYNVPSVSAAADAGAYCVEVTGACNTVTNCATLSVAAGTSATPLSDMTKFVGESVTFSTAASGTGPFTFLWFKDGAVLGGADSNSLTISNLSLSDSGVYCVSVSGACNSITNCARLTVQPITYTVTTTASPSTAGSTSGNGSFTNGATVTVVATANPGYSFVDWTEDGVEVSTSASYTFTVTNNRNLVANFISSRPVPLVHLAFNEKGGTNAVNTGSAGGLLGLTVPIPVWRTNAPSNVGGASAVDFGGTTGNYGVDSAAPISALGGLTKFTITGWLNNRDIAQGSGGNRVVTWLGTDNKGVELVYRGDGSLILSVNEEPATASPRSSTGKIPANFSAPAENWRFFAATYDAMTARSEFYFGSNSSDAALDVVKTYPGRGAVGPATARLTVGHLNPERRAGQLTRMFRGLIDEVQIFGSVLSSNDIVAVQRSSVEPPTTPSLITISQESGQVRLRVVGQTGRSYRVLANSTVAPANWMPIRTNVVGASGFFEIIDPTTGVPMRFYQAVSP